ncbi:serine/threonine-protein kinase [Sandaracinus amylolyticus]|uniref:Serine/threonine protein kinase PrkC, regulator of stationary phase n=1 Tax=Sandaracinus amylolyticus TaxID=927083 RepID=A0A0F6YNX0_9BACT|nr:serine/threonine-protein kinase [Sandaracinus amylolyticus]AKF10847.1 Serine/threonine protein kinase PrkC, regulator of stationary phase [Sandaracinus amylolyticus]
MTAPGDTLGPYVIEAEIASGGMGVVYRARNRVTGQLRALKVVRPELGRDPDFVDRFVREATIASQLQHPNLVETHEPGIDGGTIYLPMELLEGETLASRLRRVVRVTPSEAAAILVPIAEAVQLLNDRGLVHRDLKPGNVFLARTDAGETPKVIDLGTTRDVEDDEHTHTGMVIGSPFYMAIEQAEGRRDIDARADQYALGVIAYQMLTGARPYESDDSRSALAKLLRGDPYAPPSTIAYVGPALERVIERALQHDRERRFPTTLAFARAFAEAARSGVSEPPTSVHRRAAPARRRALVGAAIVAALAAFGGIAALVVTDRAEPPVITVTPLPPPPRAAAAPATAPNVEPAPPAEPVVAPAASTTLQADPAPRPARRRARARRDRAPSDADCGAATGIPCLD